MNEFLVSNTFQLTFYGVLTLISMIPTAVYARYYRKKKSKVLFYSLLMTIGMLLALLSMSMRMFVVSFNLTGVEPFHTVLVTLLVFSPCFSNIIPILFVSIVFTNQISSIQKWVVALLTMGGALSQITYALHYSHTTYYSYFPLAITQLSYLFAVVLACFYYIREESALKKSIIKQIFIVSLLCFPLIQIDNLIQHFPATTVELILSLVKPLCFASISFILLKKVDAVSMLYSSANRNEDFDYSIFANEFNLTPREHEVIVLVIKGFKNSEISTFFGIREKSVENHLTSIYKKCGVNSRVKLMVKMIYYKQ